MAKIQKIMLSIRKGEPVKTPSSVKLIENFGLEGDRYASQGSDRQISLADQHVIGNELGLCTKKFVANLVTDGLDYTKLSVGQNIVVSGCVIALTQIGKSCYDKECKLFCKLGHSCGLTQSCAYGRIVQGGTLCVSDEIYVECRDRGEVD